MPLRKTLSRPNQSLSVRLSSFPNVTLDNFGNSNNQTTNIQSIVNCKIDVDLEQKLLLLFPVHSLNAVIVRYAKSCFQLSQRDQTASAWVWMISYLKTLMVRWENFIIDSPLCLTGMQKAFSTPELSHLKLAMNWDKHNQSHGSLRILGRGLRCKACFWAHLKSVCGNKISSLIPFVTLLLSSCGVRRPACRHRPFVGVASSLVGVACAGCRTHLRVARAPLPLKSIQSDRGEFGMKASTTKEGTLGWRFWAQNSFTLPQAFLEAPLDIK